MNNYYIYGYFGENEECFYIGKGKERRAKAHLRACFYETSSQYNTPFYRKLRAMLKVGIQPIIKILSNNLSETDAIEMEIALIKTYGKRTDGTGTLWNLTDGGEAGVKEHTEEAKENMRRNAYWSGREMPQNIRDKVSEGRLNISKERKKIIAKTFQRKRGMAICKFDLVTGKIIKAYVSIRESETQDRYQPRTVSDVLKGRRESHDGFGWRYLTEDEANEIFGIPEPPKRIRLPRKRFIDQ